MQPSRGRLKPCLARAKCASSRAEFQLCSEARSGRVPGARLLCPGRTLPRLASLLGFLPRKEQPLRSWQTPLAPSWPQLHSCIAFAPRPQSSFWRAYRPVGSTLPRAPIVRGLFKGRDGYIWSTILFQMWGPHLHPERSPQTLTLTLTLNPHPHPLPEPLPSSWILTLTLNPYPHPHPEPSHLTPHPNKFGGLFHEL